MVYILTLLILIKISRDNLEAMPHTPGRFDDGTTTWTIEGKKVIARNSKTTEREPHKDYIITPPYNGPYMWVSGDTIFIECEKSKTVIATNRLTGKLL